MNQKLIAAMPPDANLPAIALSSCAASEMTHIR
jgi:hypothetical protein